MILPSSLLISVLEDAPTGIAYAKYTCTDADEGDNGMTSFSILSGSPPDLFTVASSGSVLLQQQLDFESTTAYNITVACSDAGTPALTSTATLIVEVSGINEYPPVFEQNSYNFSIPEITAPGTILGSVNATDSDDGVNGVFHYEVLGGTGAEFFSVASLTGEVLVKRPLNASENSQLSFLAAAIDRGPPAPRTSTALISVSVGDENSPPFFSQVNYVTVIPTSQAVGESILDLTCFDSDLGQNAQVRMTTVSNDLEESVYLQSSDMAGQGSVMGSLIVNGSLDAGSYELIILCMDSGTPLMGRNTSVTVIVQGSNMAPVFNQSLYGLAINENTPLATSLLTVFANDDSDAGVTYSITGGTGAGTFAVNENTGVISLKVALNYEATTNYLFTVAATDKDPMNPQTGHAQVAVTVENVNDIPPDINPKSKVITISEQEPSGTVVQEYTCEDPDGGSVTISISPPSAPFAIDSNGEVTTTSMLDYEAATSHAITVTCRDTGVSVGDSVMSSTATLSVIVMPFNFDAPQFTSQNSFNISENATVGSTVATIASTDPDNRGTISYSTSSHTNVFSLNPSTGVISLLSVLDREATDVYVLQITASDNDNEQGIVTPMTNTTTIQIYVTDINDNSPTCALTLVAVNIFDGQYNNSHSIFNASCSDADIGLNGEVRYQVVQSSLPPEGNFSLDSMTGELTFTGTITTASSTAIVQIKVQDLGTDPVTNPVTIQVILTVRSFDTPFFEPSEFNVTIPENLTPLSLVFNGSQLLSSLRNTKGGMVMFSLSIASPNFVVDSGTGNVVLNSMLDYDTLPRMYALVIRADVGSENVETILTVQLTDYNDNPPQFPSQIFNATVLENQPNGTFVVKVTSTDADSGTNAMAIYSISGSGSNNFQIDRNTGRITTLISFDRETIDQYSFIVTAMDLGSPSLTSTAIVSVSIGDVNDLPPEFSLDVYPVSVNNIEKPETVLITFSVSDPDLTGSHRFDLVTSDTFIESILRVDPVTGKLILKAPITGDYNPQSTFTIRVDDELHVDTATVILNIFEVTSTEFSIVENTLDTYNVFAFLDLSFDITSEAIYSIEAGDPYDQFDVTSDGILMNTVPLDRENTSIYTLQIAVTDNSTSVNINFMIEIIVGDQNDNSPIFSQSKYQFRILEQNYGERRTIGQVNATDRDDPNTSNGRIGYSFFAILSAQLQRLRPDIDSTSGEISILGLVDRETDASYSFRVRASDFGGPTRRTTLAEVEIVVEDVNDQVPEFEPQDVAGYRIFFTSGARIGSVAEMVEAFFQFSRAVSKQDGIRFSDFDLNDNVTASIDTPMFVLTNTTSPVYIVARNDISVRINESTFVITITDAAGHQAQKNITVIVTEPEVPTTTIITVPPTITTLPTRGTIFPQTTIGMIVLAVAGILLMAFIFFFCCVLCYSYQYYIRRKARREK